MAQDSRSAASAQAATMTPAPPGGAGARRGAVVLLVLTGLWLAGAIYVGYAVQGSWVAAVTALVAWCGGIVSGSLAQRRAALFARLRVMQEYLDRPGARR